MARRVEEIKRVQHSIAGKDADTRSTDDDQVEYQEEYYDVGDSYTEESGLNAASGALALLLLALAIYLIWAALS